MILPSRSTSIKLFATGSTVGPLVDSLHNQCLLEYDILPINIHDPTGTITTPLICTSWLIPPLLGIAYVILGGVLPRICSIVTESVLGSQHTRDRVDVQIFDGGFNRREKAIIAVLSTASIIRFSEVLETAQIFGERSGLINEFVMAITAVLQWTILDGTPAAFLAAALTSVGGPLSELPFVATGCWHYISNAADYFPLSGLNLGWSDLALSSITGPCYFAVTMDAIALGRWFDDDHK